jgi:hypothetical protein
VQITHRENLLSYAVSLSVRDAAEILLCALEKVLALQRSVHHGSHPGC